MLLELLLLLLLTGLASLHKATASMTTVGSLLFRTLKISPQYSRHAANDLTSPWQQHLLARAHPRGVMLRPAPRKALQQTFLECAAKTGKEARELRASAMFQQIDCLCFLCHLEGKR